MSIRADLLISSPPRLSLDDVDWSLDAPVKAKTVSKELFMHGQHHKHSDATFKHALMQTRVVHQEVLVDHLHKESTLVSDGVVPVDSLSESRVKPFFSDAPMQGQSTPGECSEKHSLDITTSSNAIPLQVSTRSHSTSDFLHPCSPPFESATPTHSNADAHHSHSASPNSIASAGSPVSRATSSVSTCSTSTSSSSSASVARDRSQRLEPQLHTIVPLAQELHQKEHGEHDMSLLESMHELSLVDETMNQTMKLPQEDEIASELDPDQPPVGPSGNGTDAEDLEATQILPAEEEQDTPVVTPPQATRDDIKSQSLLENAADVHTCDFFNTPAARHDSDDPFELQHNLTIDTLAQMHQHQYWTPFVNKRNKRQQQQQQLLQAAHTPRNNLQQLDLSSITRVNKENHVATFSPSTPLDCYESVSNFTTPYSQKKSHTRLEAEFSLTPLPLSSPPSASIFKIADAAPSVSTGLDGHEYDGPFRLKSELECAEFFRNRRGDAPSPWQTFQLYDPVTELEVPQPDWVRQLAINGFKNGDEEEDDEEEETEEVEEEEDEEESGVHLKGGVRDTGKESIAANEVPFNPSTPITRSPDRLIALSPFESPFQPPVSTHASQAVHTFLQADASFSFSPIPAPPSMPAITPAKGTNPTFALSDCTTPYSAKRSQASTTSNLKASSQHPISILKTPQHKIAAAAAAAAAALSSPDMHFALASPMPTRNAAFAAGDLFLSPIPTTAAAHIEPEVEEAVGNDVRKLELQLSAAAARAYSSMNTAPHQPKSVRFDVPSSHETTLNSSSEQDQVPQQAAAANIEPFLMHRLQPQLTPAVTAAAPSPNSSHLSFVHELSNFDTTALEASVSNHNLMFQQQPRSEFEGTVTQPVPSPVKHQKPFRFDTSTEFSVGIVEFDPNVEGNRGRPLIPSSILNKSVQSQSINSFFVPFEKLDQTNHGFAQSINGASASFASFKNTEQSFASSTSSNEGSSAAAAPFTIIVDAPADAPVSKVVETAVTNLAQTQPAVTVEDGLPESSFYTSSSSDSQNDSMARSSRNAARTPARVVASTELKTTTTSTSLLALPSSSRRSRSRRSSSSSPASKSNVVTAFERASARIPITRAHTDSAHTIRVRARYHRKNRCATGQKKRSMRILPASVAADINRTLTFDSSSSSASSSMNDSKHMQEQTNFTFNMSPIAMNPSSSKKFNSKEVLSSSPVELQKLRVEMIQKTSSSQRRMQPSRASRSPSSSPPSRRHLDFSSHAPELHHGGAIKTPTTNGSWLEGNDSACINLSQSFEAVTEWGPTPRKLNRSASYSLDSSFASSAAASSSSLHEFSSSRVSDSPLQFTQLPSTPLQDAMRTERYEPLAQPLPLVESDIDFTKAHPHHHHNPTQAGTTNLYESHQLRSKLRAHFSPHSVEAIMARRRLSPNKLKQLERLERELFAQQRIQEQLRMKQQSVQPQAPATTFPVSPIPRRASEQVFSPGFASSFEMNPHPEIPPQPASPFRAYPLADSHQQRDQQRQTTHHAQQPTASFSPVPEVFQQQQHVANNYMQFQPQAQFQQQMMPVQLFMCVPVPTSNHLPSPLQPVPLTFGQHPQSQQPFAASPLPLTAFAPQLDRLQAELQKFSAVNVSSRIGAKLPQSPTVFPSFVPWSRGVRPLSPPKLQPPLPTQAFAAKLSPSAGLSEARHRLCMSLSGAPTRASAARHVTPSFHQYH